jgi:hypothetical protein
MLSKVNQPIRCSGGTTHNWSASCNKTAQQCPRSLESHHKLIQQSRHICANRPHEAIIFAQGMFTGWTVTQNVISIAKCIWEFNKHKPVQSIEGMTEIRIEEKASLKSVSLARGSDLPSTNMNQSGSNPMTVVGSAIQNIPLTLSNGGSVNGQKTDLDFMQNRIKDIMIALRQEEKLDGSGQRKKVHLNEIATSTRALIWRNAGLFHPDDIHVAYPATSELLLRRMNAFIQEIAPNVNSRTASEAVFLGSGGYSRSSDCIKNAAKALMENISKQSQGFRTSIGDSGNIIYVPPGVNSVLNRPLHNPHQYDPSCDRNELDTYSPFALSETKSTDHPSSPKTYDLGPKTFSSSPQNSDSHLGRALSETVQTVGHGVGATLASESGNLALGILESYETIRHGKEALEQWGKVGESIVEAKVQSFAEAVKHGLPTYPDCPG